MDESTSLYRHFSGQALLYVGISLGPVSRLEQHRHNSSWANQIDRITIERFPSREEASAAEIAAIKAEKPQFNKQHSRPVPLEEQMAFVKGMLATMPEAEAETFRGMFASFGIEDASDLSQWKAAVDKYPGARRGESSYYADDGEET